MPAPDDLLQQSGIRVMIVDDHEMVAESFRRIIESEPEISGVLVVGTVSEARSHIVEFQPHVVLMDYRLPDGDGVTAGQALKQLCPGIALVLLTGATATQTLVAALDAGFAGYLQKTSPVDRLAPAILQAARGELVLSPTDLARLLPKRRDETVAALTPREQEILNLLADGLSNKALAERLVVSVNTVRKHVQVILTKLEAHSKLEAVIIARRRGLIEEI